jgi:hypothetical protein
MANLIGKINNTVLDFVRGVPFQTLNKFEINISTSNDLFSSAANSTGLGSIANLLQTLADFSSSSDPSFNKLLRIGNSILLQLYAQSVSVSLPEIETNTLVNGVKYIKDIKMPEDFEVTFLEDELGSTLRLIEYWKEKIVGYDNYVQYSDTATSATNVNDKPREVSTGSGGSATTLDFYNSNKKSSAYIQNYSGSTLNFFNDSSRVTFGFQNSNSINPFSGTSVGASKVRGIEAYKCNMTLKPLSIQDETFVFPSFQMKGVFPKSIESITFSQDSEDIMMHKVKFSVDAIYTRVV